MNGCGFCRCSSKDIFKQPERTALLSVDLTNGFCKTGNLASPRVAALITPITSLMQNAWQTGVRQFLLLHDCHRPDALEFSAFAEHAVCGTAEAEAVDESRRALFDKMTILTLKRRAGREQRLVSMWRKPPT